MGRAQVMHRPLFDDLHCYGGLWMVGCVGGDVYDRAALQVNAGLS